VTSTLEPALPGVRLASGEFADMQFELGCPDCGRTQLCGPEYKEGQHSYHRVAGGGSVVWSKHSPITEFHVVPHGGTELPEDLLAQTPRAIWGPLSRLIHENADTGTGAIYGLLADRIASGELRGAAVAGFHLSRLLLDANRGEPAEQTPARPYVGEPGLYEDYLTQNREKLRTEYLQPWVGAVNSMLANLGSLDVAYHHHTYDLRPMSPRPFDFSDSERPAFQFVWKRPDDGTAQVNEELMQQDSRGGGLARLEELKLVRDNVTSYFIRQHKASNIEGNIDYPLELPLTPFHGTSRADLSVSSQHVMYDVRKDFLDTSEKVLDWVASGPWRIMAND